MIPWSAYWSTFEKQNKRLQAAMLDKLQEDDWVVRLSASVQIEVFRDAPQSVIEHFTSQLKPDALYVLKPYNSHNPQSLIDWSKL